MNLEWDEAKNRTNVRKHGFDFADAEEMFRAFFLSDLARERTMARSGGLGSV